jgi:TatD DNase family protein
MKRLIDSHVHIDGFPDAGLVRQQSLSAGVDSIICVGGDIDSSKLSMTVAEQYPNFYFSAIGVHPSNILNVDLAEAESFISENLSRCIAMGEVGLDYAYDFARSNEVRAKMRGALERLLRLAVDAGVPASVHSRSAYKDTLDIVVESGVETVFHWFDGPIHVLRDLLDAGLYVSATPAIEYSKGVRTVMVEAPLESILVETDSPVYLRSLERKSSPVDVVRVVDILADLKGLDSGEVARITTRNTERLFGI